MGARRYYIHVYEGLELEPEVLAIAAQLNMDARTVMGCLFMLWLWVDRQAVPHGAGSDACVSIPVGGEGGQFIDMAVGNVPGFASALANVGWVRIFKAQLIFPKWFTKNGSTAKTRIAKSERQSRWRFRGTHVDARVDGHVDGHVDCAPSTHAPPTSSKQQAASSSIFQPLPSSQVSPLLAREGNSDGESPERRFAAAAAAAAARFGPSACCLTDEKAGHAVKDSLRQLGLSQSMLDKLPADLSAGQLQTLASRITTEKPKSPTRWAWKWIKEYRRED